MYIAVETVNKVKRIMLLQKNEIDKKIKLMIYILKHFDGYVLGMRYLYVWYKSI